MAFANEPSEERLRHLYLSEKKSIPDIADSIDWPRSRLRSLLLQHGIPLRSRADGVRAAREKLGKHAIGTTRVFSPEWCSNISAAKLALGERTAAGVSARSAGYVEYTRGPNKGRSVHVVAMEARIGRALFIDEVVHHIDGDKHNNDINNLALMTRSAHLRLHRRESRLTGTSNGIS